MRPRPGPKHRRNRVDPPEFLRGFLASQTSQPIPTERKKFARLSPQNIRCRPPVVVARAAAARALPRGPDTLPPAAAPIKRLLFLTAE
jgi:hypothetical protein